MKTSLAGVLLHRLQRRALLDCIQLVHVSEILPRSEVESNFSLHSHNLPCGSKYTIGRTQNTTPELSVVAQLRSAWSSSLPTSRHRPAPLLPQTPHHTYVPPHLSRRPVGPRCAPVQTLDRRCTCPEGCLRTYPVRTGSINVRFLRFSSVEGPGEGKRMTTRRQTTAHC